MIYHAECPYCHGHVEKVTYINDLGTTQWAFDCKCGHGRLMFNEILAYQDYLYERELNQLLRFDKYFCEECNYQEFSEKVDAFCVSIEGNCEECPYGVVGAAIAGVDFNDCMPFYDWLNERE